MRVLVTGGAGYIGSVAVRMLLKAGHLVTVLDNLSHGHRAAVTPPARLIVGDIGDRSLLDTLFSEGRFDCIMHFAGLIRVPESVANPALYFENNVAKGITLLNAALTHSIPRFVFSSSAAVYGSPAELPVSEDSPLLPTSPYGDTKRIFEELLAAFSRAGRLRYALLRYFNVAGAFEGLGEDHRPETHLIPLILKSALKPGQPVTIYGDDYPTRDGTCLRDYVHVYDLARAHLLAMDAIADRNCVYNIGSSTGYTNREVLATTEKILGRKIPVRVGKRRAGDAVALVASSKRIETELGWKPEKNLEQMIADAWEFHCHYPEGYPDQQTPV